MLELVKWYEIILPILWWDHLVYLVLRSYCLSCVEITGSSFVWILPETESLHSPLMEAWTHYLPNHLTSLPGEIRGNVQIPLRFFIRCQMGNYLKLPECRTPTMQGLWPWGTLWVLPMDNDLILLPFNPLDSTPNMHTHHTHILTFSRGFLSGNKILP